MKLRHTLALSLLACLPAALSAQDAVPQAITQALANLVPGMAPTSVRPAPAAGLYEVVYGPEVVYHGGLRVTDATSVRLVEEVLNHQVNVEIVETLIARGAHGV